MEGLSQKRGRCFQNGRHEPANTAESDATRQVAREESQQADRTDDTVERNCGSCSSVITPQDGSDDVFIHCKQLVDTEGLQQGDTVTYDTAKSKRHVNTEDSTITPEPMLPLRAAQ